MSGKLIIFSAPSGAGKSTIVHFLLQQDLNLEFSVSATSRKPRGVEKNAVDYYFISVEEFRKRIHTNDFIEFEEVYPDLYYGTLKSEVDRISKKGNNIIFDVDVIGGLNIKKQYGNQALAIFIAPPSIEELHNRLEKRGTDTLEMIEKRVKKADYEMTFSDEFDKVIINDNLESAQHEAVNAVRAFLQK